MRLFCLDQTALFIKRDPIAEDRVIVILKFFGILPVFDLLQSLCTALLQTTKRFGILGLEENDLRSVWMINDDVAAPLAVFPVGLYRAAGTGQDPGQERMVEILFVVVVANGLVEQFIDLCGQRFCVTGPHGVKQGGQIPGLGALVKPLWMVVSKISRTSALGMIRAEVSSGNGAGRSSSRTCVR